jgi:hypothetical protein
MKLRDGIVAAVLAVGCLAAPAYAESTGTNGSGTNNSNSTGVNNSNATGVGGTPLTGSGGPGAGSAGYNSSTLAQAQSLQQQLAAAQSALDNFKPTPSGPRHFARTAQPCNCGGDAGGQERAQLEANLAKAQADAAAFLESVKNPGRDKLGDAQSTGAKVGPTW